MKGCMAKSLFSIINISMTFSSVHSLIFNTFSLEFTYKYMYTLPKGYHDANACGQEKKYMASSETIWIQRLLQTTKTYLN